jgi:hypothetical protein
MCLIIWKPKDVTLDKALYERCFDQHSHGAGFAYFTEDGLKCSKGYFKFKELYGKVKELEKLEMIIHFRNASPGMCIAYDQCHPFVFVSNPKLFYVESEENGKKTKKAKFKWAVFHNGRLNYKNTKDKSDTNCFVDEVIGPELTSDPWFLDRASGVFMLGRTIASPGYTLNKMAVMRYDAETKSQDIYIINEELWVKDHKCLFSNDSYKPTFVYLNNYQNQTDNWGSRRGTASVSYTYWIPDDWGWVWSYRFSVWRNIKNGQTCDRLKCRPVRPLHMDKVTKDYEVTMEGDYLPRLTAEEMLLYTKSPVPLIVKTVSHDCPTNDYPLDKNGKPLELGDAQPLQWELDKDKKGSKLAPVIPIKDRKTTKGDGKPIITVASGTLPVMDHLSQADKKSLRRMAMDYTRDPGSGFSGMKLTMNDCVELFRADMRAHITELNDADDPTIDRWALERYAKDKDVVGMILNAVIVQQEKIEEDRAKAFNEGLNPKAEEAGAEIPPPTQPDMGQLEHMSMD